MGDEGGGKKKLGSLKNLKKAGSQVMAGVKMVVMAVAMMAIDVGAVAVAGVVATVDRPHWGSGITPLNSSL